MRFSDSSPTLKLGPADIRLQGYIALTGLYDTANVGGSIGTNFAAIPYSNTPEGNASEFRLSSQRTRVAVRVDTKLGPDPLSAYLEADFRGTTSGTVDVTSSSFGFRVRQAWMDYNRGKLEVSGGQMFSLITPVRTQISPNPGPGKFDLCSRRAVFGWAGMEPYASDSSRISSKCVHRLRYRSGESGTADREWG